MEYITVEYTNEMGENPITEEMKTVLSGLSLEEQLDYFVVEDETNRGESNYGEKDSWTEENSYPLKTQMERSDFDVMVEKLIVCDNIIAGVFFYNEDEPVLLGKRKCTYSDSEQDGPWSAWISVVKKVVFVNKKA